MFASLSARPKTSDGGGSFGESSVCDRGILETSALERPVYLGTVFVRALLSYPDLRAPLPKILISNFHPKIDFAHNSSINFNGQVNNKYEIISEKLSFFKIL